MFRVLKIRDIFAPPNYFSLTKIIVPKGGGGFVVVSVSLLEKEEIKRRTRRRRALRALGECRRSESIRRRLQKTRSGKVRRARNTISNIWKFVQKATSLFFCKRCLYIGVRIRTKSLGFKWVSCTQIELYKCFVRTRECFVRTLKFQCKSIAQKKRKEGLLCILHAFISKSFFAELRRRRRRETHRCSF